MSRKLPLFLGILLAWEGALGRPDSLRIGSWNLRNYLIQNRWVHERFQFAYPKPEGEKAYQRRILLQVRPDVLLLQEVGSEAALMELRSDLAHSGLEYPYARFSGVPGARSGLALLSMRPPTEVIFLHPVVLDTVATTGILRGVQEIRIDTGDGRLRIFHVHLKSRYTNDKTDPESRAFRESELKALTAILRKRLPVTGQGERLLLAGDFNTPWNSPMLEDLKTDWQPLHAIDARGSIWTYFYHRTGTRELLDGFWQPIRRAGRYCSATVFPLTQDRPAGSDHRLVILDGNLFAEPAAD